MSVHRLLSEALDTSSVSPELALLWPLLGRRIAFHRRLVELTQSVKAAVLLSQVIYWTRHGRDIDATGGWFYKTMQQWEIETGLTVKEQRTARHTLSDLGLLQQQRRGIPAALHFRLDTARLAALLASCVGRREDYLDWRDGAAVLELLGAPVAYHRALADVTGSVHAGLMLSRALYLTRYSSRAVSRGWFYAPMTFWLDETGLGRWEQQGARRDLIRLGVWDEQTRGIPPRMFVRVRMHVLRTLLERQHTAKKPPVHSPMACDSPEGGISTALMVGNPPSRWREGCHQDVPKPTNQMGPNPHHRCAKTIQLNVHRSTGCLVQTPLQTSADALSCVAWSGGGDLIFPEPLLPEERAAAITLVQRCPDQAQMLLDELSGRLQKNTIHTSPIAYLRGLVQRAQSGHFVPELAAGIAAARRKTAEDAMLRARREADAQRLAAEEATPEFQAKVAERQVQVRQMLDDLRSRQRSRKIS